MDLKVAAKNLGVARYKWDDPLHGASRGGSFETSFNLDGIWGGNMYAGGAGAILPNKITSKHNFRYVPRMIGLDIVKKLRAQIDANGYKDVEMKLIGDVPWSRGSTPDTDITRAGSPQGAKRLAASAEQRRAADPVPGAPTSAAIGGAVRRGAISSDRRLLAVVPLDRRRSRREGRHRSASRWAWAAAAAAAADAHTRPTSTTWSKASGRPAAWPAPRRPSRPCSMRVLRRQRLRRSRRRARSNVRRFATKD